MKLTPVEIKPDRPEFLLRKARICHAMGREVEAERVLDAALAVQADEDLALFPGMLAKLGRPEEAKAALDEDKPLSEVLRAVALSRSFRERSFLDPEGQQ